jgi:hypothetical protein
MQVPGIVQVVMVVFVGVRMWMGVPRGGVIGCVLRRIVMVFVEM